MKKFSLVILCDEDFGVPVIKSWYVSNATQNKVNGISSILNGVAYIDDLVFKGKNFWMPITKFLNIFENINEIDLNDLRLFLEQFGTITNFDDNIFNFDLDNAYDLSSVSLNDDRISFGYKNSPIRNFYLIDLKDHIKIIPSIFSNNYYTITETEWLNFMEALEIDLSESRNLKLDAILNEKTSEPNVNLIRQMKFHCKYGKGNRFIENVLKYHQNGFILTTKQIEAVKNVLC